MEVTELAEILTSQGKTVSVRKPAPAVSSGTCWAPFREAPDYFPGGVVAYTGGLKEKILGVPERILRYLRQRKQGDGNLRWPAGCGS